LLNVSIASGKPRSFSTCPLLRMPKTTGKTKRIPATIATIIEVIRKVFIISFSVVTILVEIPYKKSEEQRQKARIFLSPHL
jgi:hypothetical protein